MNIHLLYDNNYSQWFVESIEAFFPENKDRFIVYNPSGSNNEKSLYVKHTRCESLPILKKGQSKLQEQISFDGVKNLIIHFYDEGLGRHIREIPSHVKVKWVVWGADMYVPISKYIDQQLDEFSLKHYKSLDVHSLKEMNIRIILSKIKEWLLLHSSFHQKKKYKERKIDIERVDEIYTFLDGDYEQIITNYTITKNIPFHCFSYQYVGKQIALDTISSEENTMIQVGHNATPFNNHFSVLAKLSKLNQNLDILMPLSYGDARFAQKLMQACLNFSHLKIKAINQLLPYEEYQKLIGSARMHLFYNWRQEAMGNILQCLVNGKKVYLSEKNTGFQFLKKIGCNVFSIDSDLKDIRQLNQTLSAEEKLNNTKKITEFFSKDNYIIRLQNLLS